MTETAHTTQHDQLGRGRVLTIEHSYAEGTILEGTTRADDLYSTLRGLGWLYRRSVGDFRLQASQDRPAKRGAIERTALELRRRGFTVVTTIDTTTRPVAEAEAERAARAGERSARLAGRATRLTREAEARDAAARQVLDHIPLGQPYLVDHHSYRSDRRRRERAFNNIDRSAQLAREASAATEAARVAAGHMGARENPETIANRIRDIAAELRGIDRRRATHAERRRLLAAGVPADHIGAAELTEAGIDAWTADLDERQRHLTGQLEYWTGVRDRQVREGVATNFGPADVAAGDLVLHRNRWYPVVRVNPKSVTLPSLLADWTDTARYEHLRDIAGSDDPRRADLNVQALALAYQMRGGGPMHPAWAALEPRPSD